MTEKLKKLMDDLDIKSNELNRVSAAYTGNVNSPTPALEAQLNALVLARAEVRADAALGLPADEALLNKDIAKVEAALVIARRDDLEIQATDAILLKRSNVIKEAVAPIQALILDERKSIMLAEIAKVEERLEKSASALVENLMQLEKTLMEANEGNLLREPRFLHRLPENFTLPLMQKPTQIDFSRRADIHDKVNKKLDELLMR